MQGSALKAFSADLFCSFLRLQIFPETPNLLHITYFFVKMVGSLAKTGGHQDRILTSVFSTKVIDKGHESGTNAATTQVFPNDQIFNGQKGSGQSPAAKT